MTVLLLATDELKEELFAHPVSEEIELNWITDPNDFILGQSVDACIDLIFENTTGRIAWLKSLQASITIINSVVVPLHRIHDHFIRINGWPTFLKKPVVEAAAVIGPLQRKAEELLTCFGRTADWIPDIAGFITPRVVASIINEAFFTLEENVSTEAEIDIAMKLGTNYPFGPFEWGKKIGLQNIYSLLATLSREKNRYTPSLLLKQTALA
ncbi:MAG: 3-hydroxyacyl-CoA dehydrogenase family protein [Chitinophagaceae bacterium]